MQFVRVSFQAIVGSADIYLFVGDKTGKILAHALAHDPRFAVMRGEIVFIKGGGYPGREAAHRAFEWLLAQ
jgi:hypothetical protein